MLKPRVTLLFALLVAGACSHGDHARSKPDDEGGYPPPGELIDVGGYRLHLHCTGKSGPTVVLVAGAGDFSFDWSLVQSEVSRLARVCGYDRAGLAWSDPGPTPRTMRQDAYELHTLLNAAQVDGPLVLVGHSIGGLIVRVFAQQYPPEIAGMVLVDPTHESTRLIYQGKLVRVRDGATSTPVPPVQTMRSSPPEPATREDSEQFAFNAQMLGPPKTEPPFDRLPASVQAMRLWFRSHPPRAAARPDFWAEELQTLYLARAGRSYPLGTMPLVVVLPAPETGNPPPGISTDDWQRVSEDKRRQKLELANLSGNSTLLMADQSGHHIQLDQPEVVTNAIRLVVDAVRSHAIVAR